MLLDVRSSKIRTFFSSLHITPKKFVGLSLKNLLSFLMTAKLFTFTLQDTYSSMPLASTQGPPGPPGKDGKKVRRLFTGFKLAQRFGVVISRS